MKKCINCLIAKPIEEFCRDASRSDGFLIYCTLCRRLRRAKGSEYRKQYEEQRQKKAQEILASQKGTSQPLLKINRYSGREIECHARSMLGTKFAPNYYRNSIERSRSSPLA